MPCLLCLVKVEKQTISSLLQLEMDNCLNPVCIKNGQNTVPDKRLVVLFFCIFEHDESIQTFLLENELLFNWMHFSSIHTQVDVVDLIFNFHSNKKLLVCVCVSCTS